MQSLPILEYLIEKFPGSTLLPKDLAGRARARSIAQLVVSEIQPLQNTRLDSYMNSEVSLRDLPIKGHYLPCKPRAKPQSELSKIAKKPKPKRGSHTTILASWKATTLQ